MDLDAMTRHARAALPDDPRAQMQILLALLRELLVAQPQPLKEAMAALIRVHLETISQPE